MESRHRAGNRRKALTKKVPYSVFPRGGLREQLLRQQYPLREARKILLRDLNLIEEGGLVTDSNMFLAAKRLGLASKPEPAVPPRSRRGRLLRKLWPTELHSQEILKRLNKLPGPRVYYSVMAAAATRFGLTRPFNKGAGRKALRTTR
jgi:hypothetical protein